jgi:putative membrane protein
MLQLVVALLLGGLAFLVVERLVPDFHIRGGFGSAILVAVVYGVLKMLLQKLLIIVTIPLVVLTLGLFIFVINAGLLWLTDRLLHRFEVRSARAYLLGALLLSIFDWGFQLIVRNGAFF